MRLRRTNDAAAAGEAVSSLPELIGQATEAIKSSRHSRERKAAVKNIEQGMHTRDMCGVPAVTMLLWLLSFPCEYPAFPAPLLFERLIINPCITRAFVPRERGVTSSPRSLRAK